jgi:triacylglycerol esterase/lipase EstA (alpha/beta hydrolase family)
VASTMDYKQIQVLLLLWLVMSVASLERQSVSALEKPPAPTRVDVNPSGNEGDFFGGAVPPNYDPDKPVLVFIQGLGNNAANWWSSTKYYGENDMYQYAYNAGYRTAFVNFRDADGNPGDMWRNGPVLKKQLASVCRHFNVARVNLICHSKGGIDAQTAIAHCGAYPYVAKVFTLSTPHWGSQLADLAYTSWAAWLAELIKSKNDGTYSLQTAYMSYFRSITDERSENNHIAYFTAAGTDWGPLLSTLYLGGLYLSQFGSNDGSVTVASAHNPRATHVITSKLNHENIRMGRNVWRYIEPKINSYKITKRLFKLKNNRINPNNPAAANLLVQGGALQSDLAIEMPVDSLARQINIDILFADPRVETEVIAPDGTSYRPLAGDRDTDFFKGATHKYLLLDKPEKGPWQVRMTAAEARNAYLLIVRYDSALKLKVNTNHQWAQAGAILDFKVEVADGKGGIRTKAVSAVARLNRVGGKKQIKRVMNLPFTQKDNGFEHRIALPSKPGLYNVTMDIKGTLDDGSPFARSLVHSVMIESKRQKGFDLLKSLVANP